MINLIQGDCLELMKSIPDKSIDMILCDLPYGTTANKWDVIIPFDKLWEQYNRICEGIIILFAQTPFDKILGASNLQMLKYEWIWEKNISTGFLNAKKMPLKSHENILVFYKKYKKYFPIMRNGKPYVCKQGIKSENYGKMKEGYLTINKGNRFPKSIIRFNCEKGLHPTQKPISLLEYLIKTYTLEGETVLDNCMGSGSTGIACLNTNRNFTGIEKDEKYFELAKKRIEDHERILKS